MPPLSAVQDLQELFAQRVFRVPDYQRGYAWEHRHRAELLEDIELLPHGRDHYTGTIILHEAGHRTPSEDQQGAMPVEMDIVDGQQRLTTLVILLSEVARALERTQPVDVGLARDIREQYVATFDCQDHPRHRLQLNRDCHAYFAESVLGETAAADGVQILSHQHLRDARQQVAGFLAESERTHGARFAKWLHALHEKVTRRLEFCVYLVDSQADVGVIFEVMNNRGKPLTDLEKVKNYLLYLCSKLNTGTRNLETRVNLTWTRIYETLMSAGLTTGEKEDRFLRAHWLMAYNPKSREWADLDSVKQRFSLRGPSGHAKHLPRDLSEYVGSLSEAVQAFRDIQHPSHPDAFECYAAHPRTRIKIVEWSEKLTRLDVLAPMAPLLMAARLRLPKASAYLRLLRLCEHFAFRVYALRAGRTSTGQQVLFDLAHDLHGGKADAEQVETRMRALLLHWSDNGAFRGAFRYDQTAPTNWYEHPCVRYLLYEYEVDLARQLRKRVHVPWVKLSGREAVGSVEHILPQDASGPYWQRHFRSPTSRQRLVHDLGNLVLTYRNSTYANKGFPDKKGTPDQRRACYANSELLSERELAEYADWTPTSIVKRRSRIFAWALRRWYVVPLEEGQELELDDEDFAL